MTALNGLNCLIASLVCIAPMAHAQATQRVAGEIVSVNGTELRIKDQAGQLVTLRLGDNAIVTARSPTTLDAIGPGSYIGATAAPRADGTLAASEIHVFPDSMRGVGEGHRPMERLPGSTMTNAIVASVTRATKSTAGSSMTNATVASVAGKGGARRLVLEYSGGQQTVLVEDSVPITQLSQGDPSLLVPGAHIAIGASRQANGALVANRITVGQGGYIPAP
jgi:hypothetical protein